nr:hypothetical protein [Mycobacterium tuberculosis]
MSAGAEQDSDPNATAAGHGAGMSAGAEQDSDPNATAAGHGAGMSAPPITTPPLTIDPINLTGFTLPQITTPPITTPPLTIDPINLTGFTLPQITTPPITSSSARRVANGSAQTLHLGSDLLVICPTGRQRLGSNPAPGFGFARHLPDGSPTARRGDPLHPALG